MAVIETPEQAPDPVRRPDATESQCPTCGGEAVIVSERVANNRIIRARHCEKCNTRFTEGA